MKVNYERPVFFSVLVLMPSSDRQWFMLPKDLNKAIHAEIKRVHYEGAKFNYYDALVGSLVNVPTSGSASEPQIRVGRIIRVTPTNDTHQEWLRTRSQFVSNFEPANKEFIYNYLRHDFSSADKKQIAADVNYWSNYIQKRRQAGIE